MSIASTIAYQLRPLKAIERNLFITILKKLSRYSEIDFYKYRYVGFGAPFFEDFKIMHMELGILHMDCIEYNDFAYSRQKFNNPYYFVKLFNSTCTEYITSSDFKEDRNQVIWLDFASPKEFRQQLIDLELVAAKLTRLDILKVTFNSKLDFSEEVKAAKSIKFLKTFQEDQTYQLYLPDHFTAKNIFEDYSSVIRAMALRAIRRGLSKGQHDYEFNHIASFDYADGQPMTTMTGIIATEVEFDKILKQSGLGKWEFYQDVPESELITGTEIKVPVMTISERIKIDKLIPKKNVAQMAKKLGFWFGSTEGEHFELVEGYCRFYKYLPHYSKVIY